MKKIAFNKKNFILFFGGTIVFLALVRLVFPGVADAGNVPMGATAQAVTRAENGEDAVALETDGSGFVDCDENSDANANSDSDADEIEVEAVEQNETGRRENEDTDSKAKKKKEAFVSMLDGKIKPHAIRGVVSYTKSFPDSQAVQFAAANRWGVKPVKNRQDAEKRKKELVYVGESPYYQVDPLYSSIPYLVPRAAVLLQDIGQAFYDSLYVKNIPLNKLIVTSVLRSMDDVRKLRKRNPNATEQSCHLYGTTFDICYNRYHPVTQKVRDDTLKWVLSEVLRDMRENKRCYIKYEVKQGCFHMTVR